MDNIKQIIEKYKLAPDSYELGNQVKFEIPEEEKSLSEYWGKRVPDGWYGFSLGYGTPAVWYKAIHEALLYVESQCPEFEINQIKIKYGGIRIYLDKIPRPLDLELSDLETVLYDKKLIY